MSVTQYIGARYVPLFADPLEWSSTAAYEPLTIVYYQGNSYTSRQSVPAGLAAPNDESVAQYWAITGNYNAQIEQYRQEVRTFDNRITANADAITDEVAARVAADNTLSGNLADEVTAREAADTTLNNRINTFNNQITELSDKVNWKTPEQYGAVGDGVTDDTAALTSLFSDLEEYDCVLFTGLYRCSEALTLSENYVALIGIAKCEYTPRITFDNQLTASINISASGGVIQNLAFRTNTEDGIATFLKFDASANSYNLDYEVLNCNFMYGNSAIEVTGRNIIISGCLFAVHKSDAIIFKDPQNATEYRGFRIENCRFHSLANNARCIRTSEITSSATYFNLVISDCVEDLSGVFYEGIADNVTINGCKVYQTKIEPNALIILTKSLRANTVCAITDNTINGAGGTATIRTFISAAAEVQGLLSIIGNTFFTNSSSNTTNVITCANNDSVAGTTLFVNITNNLLRALRTNYSIQTSGATAGKIIKGLIANNVIASNATNTVNTGSNNEVTAVNNISVTP